jgi:iron complex transport system ATP-binding protein
MSLLRVSGLEVFLGSKKVLNNVGLHVARGEFIGLIGPNGAGKSTLLKTILGLIPSGGEIVLDGKPLRQLSAVERARGAAYLPQEREIGWAITVERLVMLGRMPHKGAFTAAGPVDDQIVTRAMQRMEVEAFRHRSALELSGGEKARVLIARAMAQEAPLLLADEPTAGLDPAHQIGLMQSFAGMAREGSSVIASLHDLALAARWCTRLVLIHAGRIVVDGRPSDVLTRENLRQVFGVEVHLETTGQGLIVQPVAMTGQKDR